MRTFSIGFPQAEYDELTHARLVAQHFSTEHHELTVEPDAVSVLPRLVWHYDEPYADSSALPSFYLCQMARRSVTVALGGDGGDEAFAGYDRYLAAILAHKLDVLPGPARRALARAMAALTPAGRPKSAVYRLARFLDAVALEPQRRYASWITVFDDGAKAELYRPEFAALALRNGSSRLIEEALARCDAPSLLEHVMYADLQLYLPDDLLVKMDIASMACSLEVRSPFLDHHVVEFAASLPPQLKLRGLAQKYLLKRAMKGVLPSPILRRRKMGFGVPIDHWFRSELREMAHDVLLDARATSRGYFHAEAVRRLLEEHGSGRAHHHARLWSLLMLELWHRMFVDRPAPSEPPGT